MEKINKRVRTLFWFSLGLSIGFPIGILGIIFGATKSIPAMLVIGIVLTVTGFYAMPMLWVYYGTSRQDRTILRTIEFSYMYKVSEIAAHTGYTEGHVRDRIKKMITSNELTGYIFRDDMLLLNENSSLKKNTVSAVCERCGAIMIKEGNSLRCEYCKNTVEL